MIKLAVNLNISFASAVASQSVDHIFQYQVMNEPIDARNL